MGLTEDCVFVSRGDGSGYLFTTSDAKKFIKANPGYSIMQQGAQPESKAVDADEAEDKAIASPRAARR